MRESIKNYIETLEKKRKKRRRTAVIVVLCSILVISAVLWQLTLPGVAWTETSQSDPGADVETEEVWTRDFQDLVWTENWGENVAALARTQIGYCESGKNFVVSDTQEQKGYTRYGAWSGDTYGNWDTAFAAFCLNYAGVPGEAFPVAADTEQWIMAMQEAGLYKEAADAMPEPGDLIVLQKEEQETEKQIGIVTVVEEREGKTYIHTIEGNCDNQVKENEYENQSMEILGYGLLNQAQETMSPPEMTAMSLDSPNSTEIGTINERLAVELTAGRKGASAKTGETLYAKVISRYSKANNPNQNVEIAIKVGALPEGVALKGFSNGTKEVVWKDEQNNEHTIILRYVEENGESYIKFEQPAGATVEFEVQFNSVNGIMAEKSAVTLEIDKEKIAGLDTAIGGNDVLSGPLTLTWNGKNEWDPVDKKVNNAERNEIAVTDENKLSGELTYTIKANSSNNENFGEIWTDYITVTDTLTLPEHISFPAGAKVNDSKTAITDRNGNEIFYVSQKQGGEITGLLLNGKTVVYTMNIPNSHKENGVPLKEQDNLSLEMKLNAGLLVLEEGYSEKSAAEMKTDIIKNTAAIQPVPYKPYEVKGSEDSVTTVPAAIPEKIIVEKKADKKTVKAGDTVSYTLSVRNNGNNKIKVKDGNTYYQVTDRLPVYLYLTKAQQENLPKDIASYDQTSNTIYWIPSKTDIMPGRVCQFSFTATVKEATDEAMKNLYNNAVIRNTAQYKGQNSNNVDVTYKKPELKLEKTSKDEDGDGLASNGEKITYALRISNNTDMNAVMNEIITDNLPMGLVFESTDIGISKNKKKSGTYILHYGNASEEDHEVVFTLDGQKLQWDIGIVHAHETVILTYVCRVDTNLLQEKNWIWNTATSSSGGSDSDHIDVDYPIDLEKKVEQDTSATYPDKTIFDYTISIHNDKEHPSEKDNLELTDHLPIGMIPYGYQLVQHHNWNGTADREISWEDFLTENPWESTFTTVIDGRKATVKRNEDSSITLTFQIGKLKPGETVKISYRAQINLTESQKKECGQYGFTNTARVDGIEKSVTVYGGNVIGHLRLEKLFNGKEIHSISSLTEEQKNIIFELTGVDAQGKAITFSDGTQIQTVKLGEFTGNHNGLYYIFKNIPIGTYTITESNAQVEGKLLTTIFQVEGDCGVEGESNQAMVKEQQQTEVTVDNVYKTGSAVDLQKSVWALKQVTGLDWEKKPVWSNLSDKKLFAADQENPLYKNIVIYNMTVINTGSETVHLDTLLDELPEELDYIGIRSDNDMWNHQEAFRQETTTKDYGNLNSYNGEKLAAGVKINAAYDKKDNRITFFFAQDSGGYELESGMALTFLVACEVNDTVKLGKPMINTAKLPVDEKVSYLDYEEIKTTHTPYDQIQNNGGSKDLGTENGKRIISSSVTVIPENTIVPGIAKKAVSYIVPGKTEEIPLTEESNIQPDSTVKWEITLYNDGTRELTDYRVEDEVTSSFHLMTRKEAQEKEISSPYKLEIYSYNGQLQQTFDVSEKVWKIITEGLAVSSHVFDFKGTSYTIPAGGYAKLTLYTNNTIENYKVYKNTATMIPAGDFNANQVKHGELVKDDDGKYIGVKASDEVNALGDYASVSWKTITEKGNETNTARGTQEKNYITLGTASEYVTYTNNIRNISGKNFSRFAVIDLMPGNNDTGVINQEDKRGSEFIISFAEELLVYVIENGQSIPVTGYTAEFSAKTSFTQEDFDGAQSTEWHETWQENDRSFRIRLSEDFILTPHQTLVVSYDGKISKDAAPGEIAWNSFGYQYYSGSHITPMKAEPPKVGVVIPKVPGIKKEVIDSNGNLQEHDAGKLFTFELAEKGTSGSQKLCEFTVCQGGYMELSGLQDKNGKRIVLENGKEYVITEVRLPKGYELVGIGEKGGTMGKDFTFTYYDSKDITILARNKVDTYQYELPETGGFGTIAYTAGGVLLIMASLLYGYWLRRKSVRRYPGKYKNKEK